MIRISITPAAFKAIARPLGERREAELSRKGELLIWLEARVLDRLAAMRGPGESYSDVIVRLAIEA